MRGRFGLTVRTLSVVLLIASTLQAKETLSIAIRAHDVETLGGWPLDRKWHAIALQNLCESGARNIFIDLAFPTADIVHPESDEFFYEVLLRNANIFLLAAPSDSSHADSLKILGRYAFPVARTFTPFADAFAVEHNRLLLKPGYRKTIMKRLLPENFKQQNILIPFPTESGQPDFRFLDAVKNSISCAGKDIYIYLDFPGVTSYIVNENTQHLVSTSELQWHAAEQIRLGNFKRKWPGWQLAGVFLVTLLPIARYQKALRTFHLPAASLILVLVVFTGLSFGNIYVAPLWLVVMIIPLGFLGYQVGQRMLAKKIVPARRTTPVRHHGKTEAAVENEMKALREKLDFYEHLSNQAPPSSLKNKKHPQIYYHPDSPLVRILQKAEQIASDDIPVIIFGESGTGKEHIAKFIHENSGRSEKPFIPVNCGSLHENLIESELFGYEAGAFTGATKRKIGRFELADGGTLFLDEVGETSLAFQVKLLRVLQEGIFERVGGVEPIRVSVRIIAATHRDLQEAIRKGKFREDVFYRLNGYVLHVPPLRERVQDVEVLFKAFLYTINSRFRLSDSILAWLKVQRWPGNVRELQSATRRAVINAQLKNRTFLLPEDFELQNAVENANGWDENLSEKVLGALRRDGFRHRSLSVVAKELAIHRTTVTEYLRGWVIRFLLECDFDLELVCDALSDGANIENREKFRERVRQYAGAIRGKISEGLEQNEPDNAIKHTRFKNLPGEFEQDLLLLIRRTREGMKV